MLAVFAAWAIPSLQRMPAETVTETWTRQFSARLSGHDFNLVGWLMNMPRALAYFLPWTILLAWAAVRRPSFSDERTARIASGLTWGIVISFVSVSVLPGALARYTMPLIAPAAWLVALLLTAPRDQIPRWLSWPKPAAWPRELRLPVALAFLACVAIAIYAFGIMSLRQQREKVRPIARQINAALPAAEPLYAVDPDFQPALFYVRDPIVYLPRLSEVPRDARYLLVQTRDEPEAIASARWQPRSARPLLRVTDYRGQEVILLEVGKEN
jgi:hypothetical protein